MMRANMLVNIFPADRPFPFFIAQLYLKVCSQGRLKKFRDGLLSLCT